MHALNTVPVLIALAKCQGEVALELAHHRARRLIHQLECVHVVWLRKAMAIRESGISKRQDFYAPVKPPPIDANNHECSRQRYVRELKVAHIRETRPGHEAKRNTSTSTTMDVLANVDPTSSNGTASDPFRPSFFELVAQEQLSQLLKPAVRYVLTVLAQRHPRYLLRIVNRFDEVYALLMLAVERHYLRTWSTFVM